MNIYDILKKLNINYKEIEHEKVCTIKECENIKKNIEGVGCKNLFLTNKKGKYYLILQEDFTNLDIKKLTSFLNEKHLSFGDKEELKQVLNLEAGSVTPLGIINDSKNLVTIIISKNLVNKVLLVHPNTNCKTLSLAYNDLIKFIEYLKHEYKILY